MNPCARPLVYNKASGQSDGTMDALMMSSMASVAENPRNLRGLIL